MRLLNEELKCAAYDGDERVVLLAIKEGADINCNNGALLRLAVESSDKKRILETPKYLEKNIHNFHVAIY